MAYLRDGIVARLHLLRAHLARHLGRILAVLPARKAPPEVVRRRALQVLRAATRAHMLFQSLATSMQ